MENLAHSTPRSHSPASSGYSSKDSIPASIPASSGYHSNGSISTSIPSSRDSLYDANRHAMARWQTSEAGIVIGGHGLEHAGPDIPATPPVISEVKATITDSPFITLTKVRPVEPAPALVRAPLVRIAVNALLADCTGPEGGNRAGAALAESAAPRSEGSELYLLGCRVQQAMVDETLAWHERAAAELAAAAARLTSGTAEITIESNFVQMALASAIDDYATRNGPCRASSDKELLPSPILARSDILNRLRQLRDLDGANRRKLDVAVDRALGPAASPQTRCVARLIIDLVAEMANESFRRRVYQDEIEKLLAASVGNPDALHRAFVSLYALDRSFALPHQSGVERCLALVGSLPRPVQEDFIRTFAAAQADTGDRATAPALRSYRDVMQSEALLPGKVSERLQSDQRQFMTDLFAAAAILSGKEPPSKHAADAAAGTARAALLAMPAPRRRTLREIAQAFWRRIRPSTRLERAQRRVGQIIKQQAVSTSPTRAQWKIMEAAIQDLIDLQRSPARYGDVVQACVSTLTPAQCAALRDLVDSNESLKADVLDRRGGIPRARRLHLLALDAALANEPAIRHTMQAVGNAVAALRGGRDNPEFVEAFVALSACLNQHARELPDARILCEAVLKRLGLPPRHIHEALARLKTLQAHVWIEDKIRMTYRNMSHPRLETISLTPALRALEAALENQAA
ncbi:hypothetical protein AKI39_10325 [Bordetella sp. H567]|uniref:hypothetical protein n=1 Tax=Bordetella sp. H567 TaxID=1697043 RepID=UPI00081CB1CC|nr:hypothetical protein [Bordetella sp. H567]AOB31002.1 hypothetical protein AKI39_10325 [Bordetella sp. H567]